MSTRLPTGKARVRHPRTLVTVEHDGICPGRDELQKRLRWVEQSLRGYERYERDVEAENGASRSCSPLAWSELHREPGGGSDEEGTGIRPDDHQLPAW